MTLAADVPGINVTIIITITGEKTVYPPSVSKVSEDDIIVSL